MHTCAKIRKHIHGRAVVWQWYLRHMVGLCGEQRERASESDGGREGGLEGGMVGGKKGGFPGSLDLAQPTQSCDSTSGSVMLDTLQE